MTTREFFRALEDHEFSSFTELQEIVLERFNQYLDFFPRHYDYLQLIDWARSNHWIVASDGTGFLIRVADDQIRRTNSEELQEFEAALA